MMGGTRRFTGVQFNTRSLLLALVATIGLASSKPAVAVFWTGIDGNWSSNTSPGWNSGGVPNAIGASAQFPAVTADITVTQNVASSQTIGSISYLSTGNFQLTVGNAANGFTFNQDGAGSGAATISNSAPNTGTNNRLVVGSILNPSSTTFTLNDDLLISNTSGSTNPQGAIAVSNNLAGTGNLTFFSSAPVVIPSESNFSGGILLQNEASAGSGFTGNVLVRKGLVVFKGIGLNATGSFGQSTNVITLGEAGQGDAALISLVALNAIANPIVVASGTGGTTTLGSVRVSASTNAYTGPITLNGNLTVFSTSTATKGLELRGLISGAGGLTKTGAKVTLGSANTYAGTTTISSGTLALETAGSIASSAVINVVAASTFDVSAKVGGYTIGGTAAQTLKGGGTVTGNTAIASLGTVAPGASVGALTFSNNLDLSTGGHYQWELGALATTGPGTNFDSITVGGDLLLGGTSKLDLKFDQLAPALQPGGGDAFWTSSHSWKIVDTTTNTTSSNFASITGAAGPGTWDVSLGSGADAGDIFLNFTFSAVALTGDVNNDHIVNQLDLNVVFGNWLATGATVAQGDANDDTVINQLDINTITGNWLATGPAGGLSATSVPEPASWALLCVGIAAVVRGRRRHR